MKTPVEAFLPDPSPCLVRSLGLLARVAFAALRPSAGRQEAPMSTEEKRFQIPFTPTTLTSAPLTALACLILSRRFFYFALSSCTNAAGANGSRRPVLLPLRWSATSPATPVSLAPSPYWALRRILFHSDASRWCHRPNEMGRDDTY